MSKFSLILSPNVFGTDNVPIHELCRNGVSYFQTFYDQIENDRKKFSDLAGAISILQASCYIGTPLPKNKFRLLKGLKLNCNVYEAKKDGIRIYAFQDKPSGRIIVLAGDKTSQDQDIKKVEKIIKEYYTERDGESKKKKNSK